MTLATPPIPVIATIGKVGSRYRAWLVDVWGVMHNGHRAFPRAVAATRAFRERGGIVVLLSNSPRPSHGFTDQLRRLGVTDDAYDATVTSGDLTRHELAKHADARVFHLGPERDLPIFAGLDVSLVGANEADLVVCSGLFDDETETPADYASLLRELARRKLPMICANPDHLVERGDQLVYCAGALAAIYAQEGGSVVYAGKPHAPIYELALATISKLAGQRVGRNEVLAIGDGIDTDIAGAAALGIDAVYVASGLHLPAEGASGEGGLDAAHLAQLFARSRRYPIGAMPALEW